MVLCLLLIILFYGGFIQILSNMKGSERIKLKVSDLREGRSRLRGNEGGKLIQIQEDFE